MSDIKLGITIKADGSAQVTGEIDKIKQAVGGAGKAAEGANRQFAELASAAKNLAGSFVGLYAIKALATDILNTNREMESLRAQLKALSGSLVQSQRDFAAITKFAKDTPFEVAGLTKTFVILKNMGIEPTQKVMQSLTDQASKLGGSQETLTSIAQQLGQAYSKGALQMEDMRVLMERGVPVMDLLQQVTGKNAMQLAEMSDKGTITRDVIDQLIVKMGELASGSNAAAMDTLNGKISNLSDAWHTFEDTLLNDKSEGLIRSIVESASSALNILSRNMSQELDDQIAQSEARIKTFDSFGAVGRFIGDLIGYDPNLEKNRAAAAKRQKARKEGEQSLAEMAKQSASAQKQTWEWLSDAEETYVKKSLKRIKTRADEYKGSSRAIISEAQQEAEALQAQYQRMAESLAREAALKGNSSRLAALEYDLAAGALSKLTEAQKLYLLQTTSEIENAKINAKIAADKKAEMDQLIDKYNQLTLSARDYYQLQLTGKGIAPDQQGSLLAQYDKNAGAERQKAEIDAATQSVESYIASLDTASDSMQNLGDISSAVFDGALGGLSAMVGAINNMSELLSKNNKDIKANAEALRSAELTGNDSGRIRILQERNRLEEEGTAIQIGGIRQVAGAYAQSLKEGSSARQAFHIIEMVAGLAELQIKGAAAMLTQGTGDPYTAFARMAAMGAMVAGIIGSVGGIFSGGDSIATMPTGSTGKGTVLGSPDEQSDSVNKTHELLKDIHAEEYAELRGINSGISGLVSSITGALTNAYQGGGFKDAALNLKVAPALSNGLRDGITLLLGGVVGYALTKIPVIGDILTGIGNFFINGLFGKTTKKITGGGVLAGGTSIGDIMDGQQLAASQYNTIQTTKKSWFSKKVSYSEKLTPIDAGLQDAMTAIFEQTGQVMLGLADSLGGDLADRVKNYIVPAFRVELRGLKGEEAVKKLNGVISATLDTMAADVFGDIVGQYQQLGEGMLETAVRIVAEVAIVRDSIGTTGQSLASDAILIADSLVQAAGGLEEFRSQFDIFFDKFFTDVEKQARLTKKLGGQLAEIFPPETISILGEARSAYRAVMDALDLTNALDRERYSLLLSLAGAADQYYSALEEGQRNLADSYYTGLESVLNAQEQAYQDHLAATEQAVTDAMSALQRAVAAEKEALTTAYNAQVKTAQGAIDKLRDSVSKLTSISNALKLAMQGLSTVDLASSRSSAQGTLRNSLGTLRGGGIPDQDALQQALNVVAQPSEGLFSSFVDYQRDFFKTAIDIDTMSKLADAQLAKQKSALQIAEDQLEFLKLAHEQQLQRLDAMIEQGQGMIDAMNGLKTGIGSVLGAVNDLQGAIAKAQTARSSGGGVPGGVASLVDAAKGYSDPAQGTIASLYAGLLGRAPDTGGLNYWTNALNSGQTVQTIADNIKSSAEYQTIKAVRGYASGGDHPGGWRLVGEQGPELEFTPPSRIVNNSDSRKLLSYDELIAEIKSLRADMRAGNNAVAQNTKETAKQLKKWDIDGMPAVTT